MQGQSEKGLVEQYVSGVRALAVRAYDGESVEHVVQEFIEKACSHLSHMASTTPAANLAAFAAQLKFQAALTHESQPAYKNTLLYAASLIPQGG